MTGTNNVIKTPQLRRRNTHQKQIILDTLIKLGSHVSAGEIYKEISKTSPDFSRSTVFRVLSGMADDGILLRIYTTGGECKFDITTAPHYHIVCRKCGRLSDVEFDSELNLLSHLTNASEYTVESGFIELSGICPECEKQIVKNKSKNL